jgi:hypothetical protein
MTQTRVDDRAPESEGRIGAKSGATRIRVLAEAYPELRTFTPDATLTEIKIRYGLNSFEEVRELGRRRQQR